MKRLFITCLLLILITPALLRADIVERITYSGDTLLKSTCTVTQTGPMELTFTACKWTTTGRSKLFSVLESMPAQLGLGELGEAIKQGKAEWSHGRTRVRAWLRDKQGNIIERSRTRVLTPTVLAITAGATWVVYMVDGPGVTMNLVLEKWNGTQLAGSLDYLLLPFEVPAGTIDLSGIKIEVFTVKSGRKPPKGLFEK